MGSRPLVPLRFLSWLPSQHLRSVLTARGYLSASPVLGSYWFLTFPPISKRESMGKGWRSTPIGKRGSRGTYRERLPLFSMTVSCVLNSWEFVKISVHRGPPWQLIQKTGWAPESVFLMNDWINSGAANRGMEPLAYRTEPLLSRKGDKSPLICSGSWPFPPPCVLYTPATLQYTLPVCMNEPLGSRCSVHLQCVHLSAWRALLINQVSAQVFPHSRPLPDHPTLT